MMHLLKGRKMSELTNPLTPTLGSQPYKDRRDCSSYLHGTWRISGPDLDSWRYLLPGCHCHSAWLLHLSAAQTPLHILSCWQCPSRRAGCDIHKTATQENSSRAFLEILAPLLFLPAFFSPLPTCVFSPRGLRKYPSFRSLCIWSTPRLYFSFVLFLPDIK